MKVGLITIGQSPRTDVVAEIRKYLEDAEIIECGALDGMSLEEIKELSPDPGEYILVTRIRSGTQVMLGREKLKEKVQGCIDKVSESADIIVFMCTGEFPGLRSTKIIIDPSALLGHVVKALNIQKLGVIIPSHDQRSEVRNKWIDIVNTVLVEAASPYADNYNELMKAASRLKDCDLIVLDCMGYRLKAKKIVEEITGKPVILARTLVGRIIGELVGKV